MKVWLWLPESTDPVHAAEFTHDAGTGVGSWTYTREYLQMPGAYSPDPLHLPLTPRTSTTKKLKGWFGVLDDAAPGIFGRQLLRKQRGMLTEEQVQVLIPAHGSGVVLLGDATPERLAPPPSLEDVAAQAAIILSGALAEADNAQLLSALTFVPSTGGAKPKMDLLDESGWMCMIKFPDSGDSPALPRIEAGAMELAARCGIEVSEPRVVRFEGKNGMREGLLQRRFDRVGPGSEMTRLAYASGHTVLELDDGNEDYAHYGALSHELMRWCGRGADKDHAVAQRRELWRRIVFNGLICNADDHSRNVGVLRRNGVWSLAPAFDLVPQGLAAGQHCALRMAFDPAGDIQRVSYEALLDCASHYKWERGEADIELRRMAGIVVEHFDAVMDRWEVPASEVAVRHTAIVISESIVTAEPLGGVRKRR
ncbi:MAG TPA: HipA domain-containing protein [Solimonas sp.]|nr:HipA domain-containing protein [Solimonas sp.]